MFPPLLKLCDTFSFQVFTFKNSETAIGGYFSLAKLFPSAWASFKSSLQQQYGKCVTPKEKGGKFALA
jgi:hypothetical protein